MRSLPATAEPAYRAGAAALLVAVAAILAALAFERIGGYRPCPLCLMQRWAYYAGIPAIFAALVLLASGRRSASALLLFAVSLGFLANAGLGVYHAGAEWGFWPGPDTCAAAAGGVSTGTGSLADVLKGPSPVVRCDRAPWTFLGLSFAGWNVVVSAMLFAATLKGAFDAAARRF